jgi:hypothetical protein
MKFFDKLLERRAWFWQGVSVAVAVTATEYLLDAVRIQRDRVSFPLIAVTVLCILALDRIVTTLLELAGLIRPRRSGS